MALTVRERRLPQLHISLDVPSCAFRHPNPPVAAAASTSGSRADGEFRLSDFERLAVLGRGNGGTVYKVAHRRTSALYALKVLHRGDPGAAAEVDALRRADCSPHVVRCHSVLPAAAASGDVALLLELVDGGSLDAVVARRGAFPELALAEGTAAYMSPERFDTERHGHADPCAADVWSLGVTILELLMGRYPLLPAGQKPSWAALMCAICFGELPSLPDGAASPELRAFVAACLQKDYTKRASVAQLLAHPFVAGRDIVASKDALRRMVAGA
ncbi:mitogen-activated protein kinase kinase 9-like [Panicum miliaceum]|uniref:mitogen-activated protein kinase kinase n=1 Tax=Panicum miliaceum TaxID=4540 RepID=A0A3L6SE23_PANMI|nr:mitogen-activated protein kinase kinase 9-like [Panicum miliaceum]